MNSIRHSQYRPSNLNTASATSYTLFLPLNFNNGRSVQPRLLNSLLSEIVSYTGGLTQYYPSLGYWVSPGTVKYRDRILPVQVIGSPTEEAQSWFLDYTRRLAGMLEQESIFLVAQPIWQVNSDAEPVLQREVGDLPD
jgi:hypothetical protein